MVGLFASEAIRRASRLAAMPLRPVVDQQPATGTRQANRLCPFRFAGFPSNVAPESLLNRNGLGEKRPFLRQFPIELVHEGAHDMGGQV